MSDGLDPRRVAARAYSLVLKQHKTIESALDRDPGFAAMSDRDRGFARAIVSTTFRRLGQTRLVLNKFLARPIEENAAPIQAILLTGAAQLLWMGVPPHAAVSSAVSLADEDVKSRRLKGLVNAVLRKVDREGAAMAAATAPQENLPEWLTQSWRTAYGPGQLSKIANALLETPPLDLTVKIPSEREHWAAELGATILPNGTLRRASTTDLTTLPGFATGAWWAQDAAASLPAQLLRVKPGETIVDLCAAPGGKTMQLAAMGAKVIAVDASEQRMKRVTENLQRTGLEAELIVDDGRTWRPDHRVDAVLLDAPCTATGTLRRHPEGAWIKRPEDVAKLQSLQFELIKSAIRMIKPGGRLIICTCSLQPQEGEALANTISNYEALAPFAITRTELTDLAESVTKGGFMRLTPAVWRSHGGMDGFFIARFSKRA